MEWKKVETENAVLAKTAAETAAPAEKDKDSLTVPPSISSIFFAKVVIIFITLSSFVTNYLIFLKYDNLSFELWKFFPQVSVA